MKIRNRQKRMRTLQKMRDIEMHTSNIKYVRLIVCFMSIVMSMLPSAVGQIIPLERSELTYDHDFYINAVYNCHQNGLVVSTSTNPKRAERDPKRLYVLFDTTLTEISSLEIKVPFRQKISNTYCANQMLYTLYYDVRFGDYTIVGIDPAKTEEVRFTGKLPSKITENGFAVYNGFAVICNNSKRKKAVYVIDLVGNSIQTFEYTQNINHSAIEVLDVRPYDNGLELGLVYRERNRTESNSYLMLLDTFGQVSELLKVGDQDHQVISASSSRLKDGTLVVTGTYSANSMISAQGMFVSGFKNGQPSFYNSRAFTSLNNFFDYMSDRRQNQMQQRINRSNERGRSMEINVLMLVHPVKVVSDQMLVMGEVYYPTYRTVTTTTYINGRPVNSTTQVFDGYQYSHAAMLKFGLDGQYIEDYCFPISLWRKPFTLKPIVQMQTSDSMVKLAYMNSNIMRSKVITNGLSKENSLNLQAGDNDRIRYTSGEVDYWYGNYFLSSGYQNIKAHEGIMNKRRDVFYLQKVEIR